MASISHVAPLSKGITASLCLFHAWSPPPWSGRRPSPQTIATHTCLCNGASSLIMTWIQPLYPSASLVSPMDSCVPRCAPMTHLAFQSCSLLMIHGSGATEHVACSLCALVPFAAVEWPLCLWTLCIHASRWTSSPPTSMPPMFTAARSTRQKRSVTWPAIGACCGRVLCNVPASHCSPLQLAHQQSACGKKRKSHSLLPSWGPSCQWAAWVDGYAHGLVPWT